MRAQNVNKAQQLKYIFECRNSGLTDYQWCNEHGIHPGTFYNWVSKLKKAGYKDIPDPISRLEHKSAKQEVVKLDIAAEEPGEDRKNAIKSCKSPMTNVIIQTKVIGLLFVRRLICIEK